MKIAITGVSGYLGSAIADHLSKHHNVLGISRTASFVVYPNKTVSSYFDLSADDFLGLDVLIHAAGVADAQATQETLQRGNVEITRHVARIGVAAKVPLVINLGSVKAAGEGNVGPNVTDNPETEYGRSKLQAEGEMAAAASGSDTQVLNIRIPLVYSGDANNNFSRLISIARSSLPVPISAFRASRSYCALGNLLAFIDVALTESAHLEVVYVADSKPIQLGELIEALAAKQGSRLRNLPIPAVMVSAPLKLVFPGLYRQLIGHAEVDIEETRRRFPGWEPRMTEEYVAELDIGGG